jgi:hypothetical protein
MRVKRRGGRTLDRAYRDAVKRQRELRLTSRHTKFSDGGKLCAQSVVMVAATCAVSSPGSPAWLHGGIRCAAGCGDAGAALTAFSATSKPRLRLGAVGAARARGSAAALYGSRRGWGRRPSADGIRATHYGRRDPRAPAA